MTTNREQGEKLLKEAGKKLLLTEKTLKEIERTSRWLAEARSPSFYGERDFSSEDAKKAFQDAEFVLTEIKGAIGGYGKNDIR